MRSVALAWLFGLVALALLGLLLATSSLSPFADSGTAAPTPTPSAAAPTGAPSPTAAPGDGFTLLFVNHAGSARFVPDDVGYTLELDTVDPHGTYVAEATAGATGTVSVVEATETVFADTATASAVIVGVDGDGREVAVPVTVSDPAYDRAGAGLSFTVATRDFDVSGLPTVPPVAFESLPAELANVTLYVGGVPSVAPRPLHRCYAQIANHTSAPVTLAESDPGTGSWVALPETIEPGAAASFPFAFSPGAKPSVATLRLTVGEDARADIGVQCDFLDPAGFVEATTCAVDLGLACERERLEPEFRVAQFTLTELAGE